MSYLIAMMIKYGRICEKAIEIVAEEILVRLVIGDYHYREII